VIKWSIALLKITLSRLNREVEIRSIISSNGCVSQQANGTIGLGLLEMLLYQYAKLMGIAKTTMAGFVGADRDYPPTPTSNITC